MRYALFLSLFLGAATGVASFVLVTYAWPLAVAAYEMWKWTH